jgi:hypothetical protein
MLHPVFKLREQEIFVKQAYRFYVRKHCIDVVCWQEVTVLALHGNTEMERLQKYAKIYWLKVQSQSTFLTFCHN